VGRPAECAVEHADVDATVGRRQRTTHERGDPVDLRLCRHVDADQLAGHQHGLPRLRGIDRGIDLGGEHQPFHGPGDRARVWQ
jgi:hypothetical protein